MKRPTLTITISGPQSSGKSLLAGALLRQLVVAGAGDVSAPDEGLSDLSAGLQAARSNKLRDLLAKARVRIFTTNEGA